MRTLILLLAILVVLLATAPAPAEAQLRRATLGAGVGVAGGAVITVSTIVARARFQREYIDSVEDLLHWQSIPMVVTPAVGTLFGFAGHEALVGSIIGSTSGMLIGAAAGAGIGWLASEAPEWPWAGGIIGAGVGMTIGGLAMGISRWVNDDDPDLGFPEVLRLQYSIPLP